MITRNYPEVLKQMERIIKDSENNYQKFPKGEDSNQPYLEEFKKIIDFQLIPIKDAVKKIKECEITLKKDLISTIIISGITIIVSVLILPFANILCQNSLRIITVFLIFLIISVFAWNIYKSIKLISNSLR